MRSSELNPTVAHFIIINYFHISGGPGHVSSHSGHKFHLGFDEQLPHSAMNEHFTDESHLSTPRKVIREIIV